MPRKQHRNTTSAEVTVGERIYTTSDILALQNALDSLSVTGRAAFALKFAGKQIGYIVDPKGKYPLTVLSFPQYSKNLKKNRLVVSFMGPASTDAALCESPKHRGEDIKGSTVYDYSLTGGRNYLGCQPVMRQRALRRMAAGSSGASAGGGGSGGGIGGYITAEALGSALGSLLTFW